MVAPNGARPMKKDHAAVPITINEIVKTGEASPVLTISFIVIGTAAWSFFIGLAPLGATINRGKLSGL